jgi:hypothetical protein
MFIAPPSIGLGGRRFVESRELFGGDFGAKSAKHRLQGLVPLANAIGRGDRVVDGVPVVQSYGA